MVIHNFTEQSLAAYRACLGAWETIKNTEVFNRFREHNSLPIFNKIIKDECNSVALSFILEFPNKGVDSFISYRLEITSNLVSIPYPKFELAPRLRVSHMQVKLLSRRLLTGLCAGTEELKCLFKQCYRGQRLEDFSQANVLFPTTTELSTWRITMDEERVTISHLSGDEALTIPEGEHYFVDYVPLDDLGRDEVNRQRAAERKRAILLLASL